ncbi:MAG: multidrug MFS transporter [Ardenticatenaceae bacterium]|nr:MAG: multidrug MFS transporter [Ardenticatenaceae bacterium]
MDGITKVNPPANKKLSFIRRKESELCSPITEVHRLFAPTAQKESLLNKWWLAFRPESRWFTGRAYRVGKRAMDLFMIFMTVPFLLPIFLFCGLMLKLEDPRGPILFKQQRTGINGYRFGMYKFRTMVTNAEELKKELMHLNELQYPDFKITNDPRITRMGRFLRKTSLDELPQLLNIFKGEMSLVGPRPTSFAADTYSLWHTERLDVLPGLTGLWQIIGRGSMEFDERVRLDVIYIERRSLLLDFLILVGTFTAVLKQKGAH